MLNRLAHRTLPPRLRKQWRAMQTRRRLDALRRRMMSDPPRTSGVEACFGYTVRINDAPNFYTMYKDLFVNRLYHFTASRPDPRILDCGSNIGMSILYFKRCYPQARVVGFEADPIVYPYLEENIARNALSGVELVQAAVSARAGVMTFYADGKYGSALAAQMPGGAPDGWKTVEVPCVRLRDYLDAPADFVKLNIEGAEWDVLADTADRLRQVRELVIEYHHLPGLPLTLHNLLTLLHEQGFEYLVNAFDPQTNPGVQPPFRLTEHTHYFLLIYAKRKD